MTRIIIERDIELELSNEREWQTLAHKREELARRLADAQEWVDETAKCLAGEYACGCEGWEEEVEAFEIADWAHAQAVMQEEYLAAQLAELDARLAEL